MRPRGIRNNNPGNLERTTIKWVGMAVNQPDPRFISFTAPEYGIRALGKVLLTYYRTHGLKTVSKIINRWAPPTENNTSAYVSAVAGSLMVATDAKIAVDDPKILHSLILSIIMHENGQCPYSDAVIDDGVKRALA